METVNSVIAAGVGVSFALNSATASATALYRDSAWTSTE